jgi:riboflavin kinase/FMN adenylyltransferase
MAPRAPAIRVVRGWTAVPPSCRGAVVAIGSFDGVHRGHQAVIREALRLARAGGHPAGIVTFEPHPRRFFHTDRPPFLLTELRAKLRLVAELGVDVAFVLRFDAAFAARDAGSFVEDVLVGRLDVAGVVAGYDFVFGRGRGGTPEFLKQRLAQHGRIGAIMAPVAAPGLDWEEGTIFSSTGARDALEAGDPKAAASILGRPFEVEGRVRRGDARGRTIGFPTANIELGALLRPKLGVYAVRVCIRGDEAAAWRSGVANLGMRPTVGGTAPRLEAHLFDFAGDLYGKALRVQLLEFLRPELKFPGLDALKAQIAEDARQARQVLNALV